METNGTPEMYEESDVPQLINAASGTSMGRHDRLLQSHDICVLSCCHGPTCLTSPLLGSPDQDN